MTSPEVDVADTANLLGRSTDEAVGIERPGDRCCRRKRGCFFVEPVLMAYCFCEFPAIIVAQVYALEWMTNYVFHANSSLTSSPAASVPSPCDPNITDDDRRFHNKVQSLTSLFTVVDSAVWGFPAVIMTILLGAGSDRLGRSIVAHNVHSSRHSKHSFDDVSTRLRPQTRRCVWRDRQC